MKKILLIENNRDNTFLFCSLLSLLEHELIESTTGLADIKIYYKRIAGFYF